MKLLKIFALAVGLFATGAYAQDYVVEELPIATINEEFYVTLPEITVEEHYYVDISHMDFEDEQEAIYLLTSYVTGNLVSNEVFYTENYMILRVHTEYMPDGEIPREQLQEYLNNLTKPVE